MNKNMYDVLLVFLVVLVTPPVVALCCTLCLTRDPGATYQEI